MPYFRVFGKPSVISVTKVGYRFYSVIKMSVSDRFRLDKIWSVSVRLSVNRLFEYITSPGRYSAKLPPLLSKIASSGNFSLWAPPTNNSNFEKIFHFYNPQSLSNITLPHSAMLIFFQ